MSESHEADSQSVLRCQQCKKPFDRQSSLKRHGYYCRSRKASSLTRSRSCIACVKGKTRCDNKRPQCSRCKAKAIDCAYPAAKFGSSSGHERVGDHTPVAKPGPVYTTGDISSHSESNDNTSFEDSTVGTTDADFISPAADSYGGEALNVDFADFWDSSMSIEDLQYRSWDDPSAPYPSSRPDHEALQLPDVVVSANIPIPQIPTRSFRSLARRPRMNVGTQRIANLIFHTLKSYPLMMSRHNSLPPFIHARAIALDAQANHTEPLTNCINLMHMISHELKGSRKLFWKNVRLECERICEEHRGFNKWELLAAMQALSIYVLVRLNEGETEYNNFDSLLITTVVALAKQVNHGNLSSDPRDQSSHTDLETNWKEWIYQESSRRICVVYQVVNMLAYFEPAAMCDDPKNLILAPLPARKQLWEATDGRSWKMEHEKEHGLQKAFGMAANGSLVKLDPHAPCRGRKTSYHQSLNTGDQSEGVAYWEEWCSGIDAFGSLVMLAASLVT